MNADDASAGGGAGVGEVVVREARPDEYARIGDLTVEAYLGLAGGHEHPDYLERLRDVAGRARDVIVLAALAADGTVVGGVTYVPGPGPWSEFDAPDEAGVRALAVAPEAQGRGVGRALVGACIARALTDGRRAITLSTRPSMVAARRLYERLGFVRDPEHDWEPGPGEWLRGYRLELEGPVVDVPPAGRSTSRRTR